MKRGKVIRFAAWSLVAGAVVNALVAQGIGCCRGDVLGGFGPERFAVIGAKCVLVQDWSGTGWRVVRWYVADPAGAALRQYRRDHGKMPPPGVVVTASDLYPDPPDTLPRWAHFWNTANWVPDTASGGPASITATSEMAVGWPVLTFSKDGDDRTPNEYRGGTSFAGAGQTTARGWTWRPIFPGVVWGSLVWAAPCALVIEGARRVTWMRRLRRGRCPACGYDRRGLAADSVCPECGGAADSAKGAAGSGAA